MLFSKKMQREVFNLVFFKLIQKIGETINLDFLTSRHSVNRLDSKIFCHFSDLKV